MNNPHPARLGPARRPSFAAFGICGVWATAWLVLSGCAGSHANSQPPPIAHQAYPPSYAYPQNEPPGRLRNYRRGPTERLFEARVTSVRAVMVSGAQRCWMEREVVPAPRTGANLPGAAVGAVIGGILGHQIGGGTGRDLATVGGLVAGAAVGAQVGRQPQGGGTYIQDVQRCQDTQGQSQVDHWDISYEHRGITHHTQMRSAPGDTITVNAEGEPRE